jgi:hypothetical protein
MSIILKIWIFLKLVMDISLYNYYIKIKIINISNNICLITAAIVYFTNPFLFILIFMLKVNQVHVERHILVQNSINNITNWGEEIWKYTCIY